MTETLTVAQPSCAGLGLGRPCMDILPWTSNQLVRMFSQLRRYVFIHQGGLIVSPQNTNSPLLLHFQLKAARRTGHTARCAAHVLPRSVCVMAVTRGAREGEHAHGSEPALPIAVHPSWGPGSAERCLPSCTVARCIFNLQP